MASVVYIATIEDERRSTAKRIRDLDETLDGLTKPESNYYRQLEALRDLLARVNYIWANAPDEIQPGLGGKQ